MDGSMPYLVQVDASGYAMGAVLIAGGLEGMRTRFVSGGLNAATLEVDGKEGREVKKM